MLNSFPTQILTRHGNFPSYFFKTGKAVLLTWVHPNEGPEDNTAYTLLRGTVASKQPKKVGVKCCVLLPHEEKEGTEKKYSDPSIFLEKMHLERLAQDEQFDKS